MELILLIILCLLCLSCFIFFFFKQKTAYEMRISDWSSDVCSSDLAIAIFENLSALGVQASIDDFGTGYAGFGYLKHFPIDVLKIDRSFVREITAEHGSDAAIADAIIAMAHSLGIRVLAEEDETEDQCRSEEHTSDLQSRMRITYPAFCWKKK